MSKNSNSTYIRQKIILSTLMVSFSLFAPSANAEYPPQSRALGEALGTALGSFLKSRTQSVGNQTTNQTQNVQGNSSYSAPVGSAQVDTTANMSDADKQLMSQGMWHDPKTGLIWMRCSFGQNWNGSACVGNLKLFHGWDALIDASNLRFGGFKDWRIPTTKELYSILERDTGSAINKVIFPNTPTDDYLKAGYWSSTLFDPMWQGSDYCLGYVPFETDSQGHDLAIDEKRCHLVGQYNYAGNNYPARAVRSGQPNGEFDKNLAIAKSEIANMQLAKEQTNKLISDAQSKRAAFRNSLKPGDRVQIGGTIIKGIVVQVNGNAILIQTSNGEQWVNKNSLYQ